MTHDVAALRDRMGEPAVWDCLADVLTERAAQLEALAVRRRAERIPGQLPPHRLLALSGDLLARLADVEDLTHRLATWFPEEPKR